MKIRTLIYSACLLTGLNAAPALAYVDIDVNFGPPPPQVEVVPEVRSGYYWIPGYWAWENRQYAWVPGRWIQERPGYVWHREEWEHHGNKWRFQRGYWAHEDHGKHKGHAYGHDRDHDRD